MIYLTSVADVWRWSCFGGFGYAIGVVEWSVRAVPVAMVWIYEAVVGELLCAGWVSCAALGAPRTFIGAAEKGGAVAGWRICFRVLESLESLENKVIWIKECGASRCSLRVLVTNVFPTRRDWAGPHYIPSSRLDLEPVLLCTIMVLWSCLPQ